jgi:RNA polymerase subunit RPABC4/transcription elongation factor Spt4
MFFSAKVIRCKKCKRVFSNIADHCPECYTKTPRGWAATIVPTLCIIIAIVVIAWTLYALSHRPAEQ